MNSGIATASSQIVVDHRRHPSGRSSFRPVPNSDTITVSSARCSVAVAWAIGSGRGIPVGSAKTSIPPSTATTGAEKGRPAATRGSAAAANSARPTTTKAAMTGST